MDRHATVNAPPGPRNIRPPPAPLEVSGSLWDGDELAVGTASIRIVDGLAVVGLPGAKIRIVDGLAEVDLPGATVRLTAVGGLRDPVGKPHHLIGYSVRVRPGGPLPEVARLPVPTGLVPTGPVPERSAVPLVRTGQGDYVRDLMPEDF